MSENGAAEAVDSVVGAGGCNAGSDTRAGTGGLPGAIEPGQVWQTTGADPVTVEQASPGALVLVRTELFGQAFVTERRLRAWIARHNATCAEPSP